MHILIKGFRSIQQFECNFYQDSITLISGPSGSGKSTLMNAILWCLYGTLRNIRKFGTKSGTCMVKMDVNEDFVLHRSKSPELLKLYYKGKDYTDKEAQEKIIELYGPQEKWMTCCYLKQGSRNLFLESSPSERLNLLNHLCFQNQDPDQYMDHIETKIQETKSNFDTKNEILKRDVQEYQKRLDDFKIKYSGYLLKNSVLSQQDKKDTHEYLLGNQVKDLETRYQDAWMKQKQKEIDLNFLKHLIQSFPNYQDFNYFDLLSKKQEIQNKSNTLESGKSLQEIEGEMQKLQVNLGQKILFESQFKQQIKALPDYESFLKLDLSTYKKLETDLNQRIHQVQILEKSKIWIQRKNELQMKISTYTSIAILEQELIKTQTEIESVKQVQIKKKLYDDLRNEIGDVWDSLSERLVSTSEIQFAMEEERNRNVREKILRDLEMDSCCNDLQIENAKNKRKFLLEIQPFLSTYGKILEIDNKVEELLAQVGNDKDYFSEKDLPSKIVEYQSHLSMLTCPHCQNKLKYENNMLVKIQNKCVNLDDLLQKIENSKKRIELKKQAQNLQDEMDQMMNQLKMDLIQIRSDLSIEVLLNYPSLQPEEINKIHQEILLLSSISQQKDFISPKQLLLENKKYQAVQLNQEIVLLSETFGPELRSILDLEQIKTNLLNQIAEIRVYMNEIETVDLQIKKLQQNVENIDDNLQDLIAKLDKCKSTQQSVIQAQIIQNTKDQVDRWHNLDQEISDLEAQKSLCLEIQKAKEDLSNIENLEKIMELQTRCKIQHEDALSVQILIENIKEEREKCKLKLEVSDLAEKLLEEKDQLKTVREKVVEIHQKYLNLCKMKMITNELLHKRMLTTLQSISEFANDLLAMLFDEPIKIDFDVFKTNKTQKTVKPSIIYKILYKGHEIDSLDQMSGGEADRISLAITCALYRFSNFPFLMLDEFASSLDLNNKEMAVQTLKGILGETQKSILCISHDTVEGIYDHHFKF